MIPIVHAAGVIDDAPTFAEVFSKAFDFLLSIVGLVGIMGMIIAGLLYFFAAGDRRRIRLAKIALSASVVGLCIALGAWVIEKTIIGFF